MINIFDLFLKSEKDVLILMIILCCFVCVFVDFLHVNKSSSQKMLLAK